MSLSGGHEHCRSRWPRPVTGCEWWGQLSRVQKWGFGALGFVVLALLPVYTPSFLNTPGISFDGVLAQFAMVALIAIGSMWLSGKPGCSTWDTSASTLLAHTPVRC